MFILEFIITPETVSSLVQNIVLLFALLFIYAATNINPNSTKIRSKFVIGAIIGGFSVLLMVNPWVVGEGLIFDTRSVLLGVSGLFFGPIATIIAGGIALIYRLSLGGQGVYAGIATIFFSSLIGIFWHKIRTILPKMKNYLEYYVFGLFVHIVTVACFLLIPWPEAFDIIKNTLIPYLVVFPIVTMILALSINNQKERIQAGVLINKQKLLLQSSLDSTDDIEIFALDTKYQYLAFNKFHAKNMKLYHDVDVKDGMNFINHITIKPMKDRLKKQVDFALAGNTYRHISKIETEYDKYLEEIITPIVDSKGNVNGVTFFSEDVTEQTLYEQNILYLSYNDPLTNAPNRRAYMENLKKMNQGIYLPLSVIMVDINGLKIINDAFGHDAGDELLKIAYAKLNENFASYGSLARIGGDEFTILLPNTTREAAMKLIDHAKADVEQQMINNLKISVSFGLATQIQQDDIQKTINEAEDDMYTHKLFEVTSHRHSTINTILNTLHAKNPREEHHSERVSNICIALGKALKMSIDDINMLKTISILHDIGKIAIDETILNKPGKLSDEEWAIIKKHPETGFRILSSSPEYAKIAQDILSHHERWDGKGYPRGLKGEEIPIRARIICIADAYDAMISERPYRTPLTHEQAIAEIKSNMGTQFDPKIAKIFIKLFEQK